MTRTLFGRLDQIVLVVAIVLALGAIVTAFVQGYAAFFGNERFDVPIRAASADVAIQQARDAGAPVEVARLADGSIRLFPFNADDPTWTTGNEANGAKIAASGGANGASACVGCHGEGGQPKLGQGVPRLAGLDAAYLNRQLAAYASGQRQNEVMQGIAKALSLQEAADVTLYYSRQSPPWPAQPGGDAQAIERGRTIHAVGLADSAIQACSNCHGPVAQGGRPFIPPLAGFEPAYFEAQITAYRSTARGGSQGAKAMQAIATRLTDADVKALGAYYASLTGG